jgi:cell division protein FtsB
MANKYFVVGLAFAVFVFFFDSFNIVERVKLSRQLRQSREELSYYNTEIVEIKRQLDELLVNDATAEKFARERYLMKRENEDVFVILEK